MTVASRLADWAASLLRHGPPAEVLQAAKRHLIDALGCGLGAWRKNVAREAALIAEPTAGRQSASIIGRVQRFSAEDAAFANGALLHGLDFDDTHSLAVLHATAVMAPAAIAVGECEGRTGREILTAQIAGTEIACRLGAAERNGFHLRGFHPTSVCGVFGAAVAAGMLLAVDERGLTNALGIAGSFASGIFAYLEGPSNPKPLHVAHAARDGVAAARLAGAGATGPDTVIEGRFGLFDSFLGHREAALEPQLETLGFAWESTRLSIKPYPACHVMHACLDAAATIISNHGLQSDQVADIEVLVAGPRDVALVMEPIAQKRRPKSATVARFSLPYSIAHLLVRGSVDIDTADDDHLVDPAVLALAERVTYRVVPFETASYALPGAVRITTRAGKVLEHAVPVERGGPHNPLDDDALLAKFRSNVADLLAPADRDALLALLQDLDSQPHIGEIQRILRNIRAPGAATLGNGGGTA